MSCGNSNCSSCSPCPECQTPLPEDCTTLGVTDTPTLIIVEDEASCKKVIAAPDTNSLLIFDEETGLIKWADGSSGQEICLTPAEVQEGGGIFIQAGTSSTCLRVLISPDDDTTYVVTQENGQTIIEDKNDLYGTDCGVMVRDCSGPDAGVIRPITGTVGQAVIFDASGNAVAGAISVNSFLDAQKISAAQTSSSQITVNYSDLVFQNGSGGRVVVAGATSVPIVVTNAGAGGLDDGAYAANTIYYTYALYNTTTLVRSACISTSTSAPNASVLSAYPYYRLIGAHRSSASVTVPASYSQNGRVVYFGFNGSISEYSVTGSQDGFFAAAATLLPATTFSQATVRLGFTGASTSGTLEAAVYFASTSSVSVGATAEVYGGGSLLTANANSSGFLNITVQIPVSGTVYRNIDINGSATDDVIEVRTMGGVLNVI